MEEIDTTAAHAAILELESKIRSLETMLGMKVLSSMDIEEENKRLREVLLDLAHIVDPEEKERISRRALGVPVKHARS